MAGNLNLKAIRADFKKDAGLITKADPYCAFILGGLEVHSEVSKHGGKHPKWNENFNFELTGNEHLLIVRVFDKEHFIKDHLIGEGSVELHELIRGDKFEIWVELKHHLELVGKMLVECEFVPLVGNNPDIWPENSLEVFKQKLLHGYVQNKEKILSKYQGMKEHSQAQPNMKEQAHTVFEAYKEKIHGKINEIREKAVEKLDHYGQKLENIAQQRPVTKTTVKTEVIESVPVTESVIVNEYKYTPLEDHEHLTLKEKVTEKAHEIKAAAEEKFTELKDKVETREEKPSLKERISEKTEDIKASVENKYIEFKEKRELEREHPTLKEKLQEKVQEFNAGVEDRFFELQAKKELELEAAAERSPTLKEKIGEKVTELKTTVQDKYLEHKEKKAVENFMEQVQSDVVVEQPVVVTVIEETYIIENKPEEFQDKREEPLDLMNMSDMSSPSKNSSIGNLADQRSPLFQ